MKTKVVITYISPLWEYFQHFLLGFYELQRDKEIDLQIKTDWLHILSTHISVPNNRYTYYILQKLRGVLCPEPSYILKGYVEKNNVKKTFCIDCADSPNSFNGSLLDTIDLYFKMQCPKEFSKDGYHLSSKVVLPYIDHDHEDPSLTSVYIAKPRKILTNLEDNLHKIRPLMIGFRRLSITNSYRSLKVGFENYRKGAENRASKKMMCYFGNAKGPKPVDFDKPDIDTEGQLVGFLGDKIHHPNEKRAIAAEIMDGMGDLYDARVIADSNSEMGSKRKKKMDLVVPITEFCAFISKFQYNLNISGYRLSIPNRFCESFIVGTAIFTDKLSVKWYKPFDEEVIETVPMGYELMENVDWEKFKSDMQNLKDINKDVVLKRFEEKWSPKVVARYIISECTK